MPFEIKSNASFRSKLFGNERFKPRHGTLAEFIIWITQLTLTHVFSRKKSGRRGGQKSRF